MNKQVKGKIRGLAIVLCLTLAGPLAASRLAYEQTGQITAIASENRDIKINGAAYRLAKKVDIHSTEKTSSPLSIHSLQKGENIGYTQASTGQDKKSEITSIWVLPAK